MFLRTDARRGERHASRGAALRERRLDFRCSRQRGCDPGHHFAADAGSLQRRNFFLCAAEEQRIAAFETHDNRVLARRIDQALVDELLDRRMLAAAFADRDRFRFRRQRNRLRMHKGIEEHDVRFRQQARRPQCEQIGGTWSGADEIDDSGHWTPTLAASLANSAAALPPWGALLAPWGGPVALIV